MQLAHGGEHIISHLLLALRTGSRLVPEVDRLAVGRGHRGELQPSPVASSLGAVDRHGHHRSTRLQREAPDPAPRSHLADLPAARAPALRVDDEHAAVAEDPKRRRDRLLVATAATDRKGAGMTEDELQDAAVEQL